MRMQNHIGRKDKHDWEWVDGYTNNCEAYDESGKIIKHL